MGKTDLHITVDPEMSASLDALADASGLTVEEYVRSVLQREVALAPSDDLAEDRASFEEFQRTGEGIPGEEVAAWLKSLTTDTPLPLPKARKLF